MVLTTTTDEYSTSDYSISVNRSRSFLTFTLSIPGVDIPNFPWFYGTKAADMSEINPGEWAAVLGTDFIHNSAVNGIDFASVH